MTTSYDPEPRVATVRVPGVSGLSPANATMMLQRAGLEAVVAPDRFAADDDAARVDGSHPPEGSGVAPGTRVELLARASGRSGAEPPSPTFDSDGPFETFVPDVAGLSENEAYEAVRGAGLDIRLYTHHYAQDYAVGVVSGSIPSAGTSIGTGSGIVVDVSLGWPPPPAPPHDPEPDAQTLPPFPE